jgi:hypothetical protein
MVLGHHIHRFQVWYVRICDSACTCELSFGKSGNVNLPNPDPMGHFAALTRHVMYLGSRRHIVGTYGRERVCMGEKLSSSMVMYLEASMCYYCHTLRGLH